MDTPATSVCNLMSSNPNGTGNYAAFASNMLGILNARMGDMSAQEIFVNFILAHLAKFDKRILRLAHTSTITTKDALMKELQVLSYGKRHHENDNHNSSEIKRLKQQTSSSIICNFCKRPGHRLSDCYKSNQSNGLNVPPPRNDTRYAPTRSGARPSSSPAKPRQGVCYVCQSPNHFANIVSKEEQCYKRVELCSVNPVGTLIHNGEQFYFLFLVILVQSVRLLENPCKINSLALFSKRLLS